MSFEVGARVVIQGFDGREGAEAEVVSIDETSGTYECKLLGADLDGEKLFCKAENLKAAAEAEVEDPDQKLRELVKDAGHREDSSSEKEKKKSKKKSKKKRKK
ncbi:unnamed protein product, partial [Symbiodinium necroappetens]